MTYKFNGTELTTQPTTAKWLPREVIGVDGNGHAVYSAVREYELTWQLAFPSDYNQVMTYFNAVGHTGTVVVELPKYGDSTYTFFAYSGCVLREPEAGEYFSQNQTDIVLLITNIRT